MGPRMSMVSSYIQRRGDGSNTDLQMNRQIYILLRPNHSVMLLWPTSASESSSNSLAAPFSSKLRLMRIPVHYGKPGGHYPHVLKRPFLAFLMAPEAILKLRSLSNFT